MKNKYQKISFACFLIFSLSACTPDPAVFRPGDMKTDFCGTHINYQYCECAFNNAFCEEIAMNSKEAKEYANGEYEKWVEKSRMAFGEQCGSDNGYMAKERCEYCGEGKRAENGRCVKDNRAGIPDDVPACGSQCGTYCQNNTLVSQHCGGDAKTCEKDSEHDCSLDIESFGDSVFPMLCRENACQRDVTAIAIKRNELEQELAGLRASGGGQDPKKKQFSEVSIASGKYCRGEEMIGDVSELSSLLESVASSTDAGLPAAQAIRSFFEANEGKESDFDRTGFIKIACDLSDYYAANSEQMLGGDDERTKRIKAIEELLLVLPQGY